jgi:nitrate/nitrite transport system ATP-binding protein
MATFLEIDHVDKVFPLPNGDRYIALKNIRFKINQGEFISLIGHSGCGKSTLLNIVAGLDQATTGGVILEGREVESPGPDRMVVFQNYSLLPWLTVRQNIALAVNRVLKDLPKGERKSIIEHHIDLVGLRRAANRKPGELSGGMKQRVAIARALAIRPKVLLLDEPFGALDALTRGNLQESLMHIVEEYHVTTIMVTHDVDEALLLSDKVVMLTTGPEAHIGQVLEVPIPRPRQRLDVVNHPSYYQLRNEIVYFLNQQKRSNKKVGTVPHIEVSERVLEKTNVEIGYLPLIDSAPLVVAQEKGFFAEAGLEVNLAKKSNWKEIIKGVATGELDAAQMTAGMPLHLTLGANGKESLPIVSALVLSRNGSSITLSNELARNQVYSVNDLNQIIQKTSDQVYTFGVSHRASIHNFLLRYWLASGGIDPDQDVNLAVISAPEMIANLRENTIQGYCLGEPWTSAAIAEKLGYIITKDSDIWSRYPEKVLGLREDWIAKYPETHLALVKALLRACEYCDDRRNHDEIFKLLSQPNYLGNMAEYSQHSFISTTQEIKPKSASLLQSHQFFVNQTNYPGRVEALWILTQFARWGYAPFPRNWVEILERVRRPDLFGEACRDLGLPDFEPNRQSFKLFDGMVFDPDDPIGYLKRLTICREFEVMEIPLDNFQTKLTIG